MTNQQAYANISIMSEKQTFNQVDQQFEKGDPQTILVERSDGTISTGLVGSQGERSAVLLAGSNDKVNGDTLMKMVKTEKLSDAHQEMLAEKLAGVALRGSGVAEVEPVAATFDPEVANLQRAIRDALAEKKRAQQEGRGDDSIYYGQIAGQYTLELNAKRK